MFFSEGLMFLHSQHGSITLSKDHIKNIKLYDPVCFFVFCVLFFFRALKLLTLTMTMITIVNINQYSFDNQKDIWAILVSNKWSLKYE